MAHGEGTNLVAVGSNVSNKLTTTYVDGTKGYTYGTWLNPNFGGSQHRGRGMRTTAKKRFFRRIQCE